MAIFTLIGMLLLWLAGTVATFLIIRSRGEREYSAFADFAGSFVFWTIMLPVFMVSVAIQAGAFHGKQYVKWSERRKHRPALRAGADNGLYE